MRKNNECVFWKIVFESTRSWDIRFFGRSIRLLETYNDMSMCFGFVQAEKCTPETNIAPENGWLEDYLPFGIADVQGLCSFQGGYFVFVLACLFIGDQCPNFRLSCTSLRISFSRTLVLMSPGICVWFDLFVVRIWEVWVAQYGLLFIAGWYKYDEL